MKLVNKKSLFVLTLAFSVISGTNLYAQSIELPEVTTVISGETEKAGQDTLPDFSDVLKLPNGSGGLEPVLPEVETGETSEVAAGKTKPVEKSVYAEGLIGGGYPAFFTGNISVARTIGASPFKFSFEHESALCYADHFITDSFSDRTTKLSVEKNYKKNHIEWGASGSYKSSSDGLQKNLIYKGSAIGLLNRDLYSAAGNISYTFDNGFSLGAAADSAFYNRYTEISCPQINTVGIFSIAPSVNFRWQGYGFNTGFTADYDYDTEFTKNILFENSHRAKFAIDLSWKNDFILLYGNAAAVIGSKIMDESVIVPFTLGVEASFPVYFANRRVSILAEGGIASHKPASYDFEENFKFTKLDFNPEEISEWYGKVNLSIPLKTTFTGSLGAEYRQTAYENGRLQPDYNSDNSIYLYTKKNYQALKTELNLAYHQGIFSVSGSWHSNWLDLSAGENKQTVKLAVNLQDENMLWGVDFNCMLPINEEMGTPILNAEGFVRITQSVRAVLNISDFIKLYKGETRHYAGKYEGRGGSASLLLKFVF